VGGGGGGGKEGRGGEKVIGGVEGVRDKGWLGGGEGGGWWGGENQGVQDITSIFEGESQQLPGKRGRAQDLRKTRRSSSQDKVLCQ